MRARRAFLALALATGLVLLTVLLLNRRGSPVQARQNTSKVSLAPQKTTTSRDNVAQGSGAIWAIETVEDHKLFRDMTDRSLALDSDGHPHIAYGEDHLYYAWYDGSTWRYQTVDSSPHVGRYASIKLDSNDRPHISYYDNTNRALKYAHWTGSAWDIQVVDDSGYGWASTSLALDSDDRPHIGYAFGGVGLRYARWTGSVWVNEIVDDHRFAGAYASLALDADGQPHIGYWDCYNGIWYARRTDNRVIAQ